jgi:hypothetical protein
VKRGEVCWLIQYLSHVQKYSSAYAYDTELHCNGTCI